jgi:hypothetical protein
VAVVWATLAGVLPERGGGSTNGAMTAGLGGTAIASPEEALEAYLETGSRAGRVVDLLPTLMVETVPTEGGGAEVFYVRQILERRMVRQFWEVGADETGEPIAVPSPGIPASGGESAI